MAIDSTALINALIDGGLTPAASRVIANALANAATPQFSNVRDVADATPRDQLRLIDSDTRKYLLTNLDYSSEQPYQNRLASAPGRYAGGPEDHPYKDSQPVAPVPPLSQASVAEGDYISVANVVQDNTPVSTIALKVNTRGGVHLRANQATKAVELVPLAFSSPQGLVTATVSEDASATNVELVARSLVSRSVVLADGSVTNVLAWSDSASASATQTMVPAGAIMPFAATLTGVSGWLLCDGTAVSRTTYADLFTRISTNYGSGDGSTTFNLPDLRGYFIRGFGTHSDGTSSGALGAKQGMATARPTTAFTTDNPGTHTHTSPAADSAVGTGPNHGEMTSSYTTDIATSAAGAHTHTITGGGDSETRPKNIALAYYIKA